jgi:serine/threonine protein kinase
VYRARDTRLGRDVALKILPPGETGTTARERVEREARIVASLNHPNVLALHDIGMHEGATYLVTEVVEGESLRGVTLPLRKSLEIAAQIADGLAAAHAAGVTHRDLKPDNVMVTHDGRVKLLDFGIATTTGLPADFEATSGPEQAGSITGTIGYMAPEQVRGNDVDSRADIFAFGAVLYELVSGDRAFQGETAADVMASVLRADPRELPGLPPPVRDIIYRCLEKKREQRFQSARDLSFALRQAAGVMAGSPESVTMNAASLPSPAAVREELAVLLGSPPLAGASRLCSLLRFIVEKTLQGEAAHLKETRIGLEVFGRKADSYDPAIDPIVRVQMGRLRFKLRAYYNGPGGEDRVRVEIPVGSYAPVFTAQVPANRVKEIVDTPPAALEDLRLAVLPIVNMSVDPDNQIATG